MKKRKFAHRASAPKPAPSPASSVGVDAGDAVRDDVDGEAVDVAMDAPARGQDAGTAHAATPRELPSTPFELLVEYERLALEHVAGLPEQMSAPGLWRGVGYRIGRQRLASGFDEVVEILPMPALTAVPGAQPWMLGVANMRGSLLPVVDLKQFLEGERTVLHEGQRMLVVRQRGGDVAVLIDELYGQRSFNEPQLVDASELDAGGRYGHFIERAYRLGDQAWGIFSLERLARTPEFRQAAA